MFIIIATFHLLNDVFSYYSRNTIKIYLINFKRTEKEIDIRKYIIPLLCDYVAGEP